MRTRAQLEWVMAAVGIACAVVLRAQVPPPPEGAPMTPALERLLDDDEVEAVASGFQYAEGPAWRSDGYLLFADSPRNRIHRIDPKGNLALLREPSGGATALAFDEEGRLLATEHDTRRISRTDRFANVTTVVDRFEGKRLNSPNDLVVAPGGAIYFTDPPYGLPRQVEGKELDFQGVFRVDPDGRVALLVRDLSRPNGIALSPDLGTLYVTDTESSDLYAFPLAQDGVGPGRVIATLNPWKPGVVGVADGIEIDETGRIYVAGPGGIWVFAPNGGRLGVIATPEPPAGCAFGGRDGTTLYITARTRLYRMGMNVKGLRRHAPAR
jgi:gluconolactonase